MVVNTPAVPLYLQSAKANSCTSNNENFFCVSGAGPTTVANPGEYLIGLTWENPDSTGAALYDGLKMKIDINVLAPAGSDDYCGPSVPSDKTAGTCTASYTFTTSVDST